MKRLVYLGVLMLLWSCSDNTKSYPELEAPTSAYEESPSPTTASNLLQAIVNVVQANDEMDQQEKVSLFTQAYNVSKDQNMWAQAAGFLNTLIKESPGKKVTEIQARELIEVIEKTNNPAAASSLKMAFAKAYPNSEQAEGYKQTGVASSIDDRISQLGRRMFNDSTHQFNQDIARQFIDACEAHALLLPQDPNSIEYLHKAGETARSTKSFRKAVSIYDWLYRFYPDDPRASQALFLQAFTYDNDLRNLEVARALYTQYLDKYPNEDFADDTQFLLKNLGKSDEEILQQLGQTADQ